MDRSSVVFLLGSALACLPAAGGCGEEGEGPGLTTGDGVAADPAGDSGAPGSPPEDAVGDDAREAWADACVPDCVGRVCGSDGCGGSCGSCTTGKGCDASGRCACLPACSGRDCGDDGCGGVCGVCKGALAACVQGKCECVPDCAGAACGDDGCGGDCGECTGPQDACLGGQCVCVPTCAGKECGDDGCGTSCGQCGGKSWCVDGECKCAPACDGAECGEDGCGGSCGTCKSNEECWYGQCVCTPACQGKQCGDDGCGSTCGSCPATWTCAASGKCVDDCVPDCAGKTCGSNGCSGSCGSCEADEWCTEGDCVPLVQCEDLPQTWGPAGLTIALETPGDMAIVQSKCPDFSGDGKGDNGLKGLASTINGELKKMVEQGTGGFVLEFVGVANYANSGAFTLVVHAGHATAAGASTSVVSPQDYGADCEPLSALDAEITASSLDAGPGGLRFLFPTPGFAMGFPLEDARVSADVTSGGAAGVVASDGVLAGILTKAAVDATIAAAEAQCDIPTPPDICSYLSMAKSFMPMLFDLDQNGDGKKDAASICLLFAMSASKIVGYE